MVPAMRFVEPDCFVCHAGTPRPIERPWHWPVPRALCVEHKRDLRMDDGQPLDDVLARVRPHDQPLEGGPLAWVFNPVWIERPGRSPLKGWTDFAAGGMAVLEDAHGAENHFESCAFHAPHALDLLYALRLVDGSGRVPAPAPGGVQENFGLLLAAIRVAPREKERYPSDLHGVQHGLEFLTLAWNQHAAMRRIRAECGRHWPASHAELLEWIARCGVGARSQLPDVAEPGLFPTLCALARRRFPQPVA
jgi:hypothetical protein